MITDKRIGVKKIAVKEEKKEEKTAEKKRKVAKTAASKSHVRDLLVKPVVRSYKEPYKEKRCLVCTAVIEKGAEIAPILNGEGHKSCVGVLGSNKWLRDLLKKRNAEVAK